MPIITTGSPIISAIGQAGQGWGQLPEYQAQMRRQLLADEYLKAKIGETDLDIQSKKVGLSSQQEALRRLLGQAGADEAALNALLGQSPGMASGAPTGAGAQPMPTGMPTAPQAGQPASASPSASSVHRQDMETFMSGMSSALSGIGRDLPSMSPDMRSVVLARAAQVGGYAMDKMRKNQALESIHNMYLNGSFGAVSAQEPGMQPGPSESALATAIGMVEAGDTQGAMKFASETASSNFRRMNEQQERETVFATGASQIAQMETANPEVALSGRYSEAKVALELFRAGAIPREQFAADWPNYAAGRYKAPDGKWYDSKESFGEIINLTREAARASIQSDQSRSNYWKALASAASEKLPSQESRTAITNISNALDNIYASKSRLAELKLKAVGSSDWNPEADRMYAQQMDQLLQQEESLTKQLEAAYQHAQSRPVAPAVPYAAPVMGLDGASPAAPSPAPETAPAQTSGVRLGDTIGKPGPAAPASNSSNATGGAMSALSATQQAVGSVERQKAEKESEERKKRTLELRASGPDTPIQ